MKKLLLFLYVFFLSAASTHAMPIMPVEDGGGSSSPPPEKVLVLKTGELLGLGVGEGWTSLVAGAIRTEAFGENASTDPAYIEGLYFWEPTEQGTPLLGSTVVFFRSWGQSSWPGYGYWADLTWARAPYAVMPAGPDGPWGLSWPPGGEEIPSLQSAAQRNGKPTRRLAIGKFRVERGSFTCNFTPAGDDSRVYCQSDPGTLFPVRLTYRAPWARWSVVVEWLRSDCSCWSEQAQGGPPVGEGEP